MTQQPRESIAAIKPADVVHAGGRRAARTRRAGRDVMASATALFFSPASSVAVLGAALAPDGTDFVEVSSRAEGCASEPRPPPTKIPAVPGAVRCGL